MARSIYCSACKNEKEHGRDNESYCKKCKSDAGKKRRAEKRIAIGLRPLGAGRSPNCYSCGSIKENPKSGYCYICARQKDNEWRLSTGRTKKHQTGFCPCGSERAEYSKSYCRVCLAKREKRRKPRPPEQIARYNENARLKRIDLNGSRVVMQDDLNVKRRAKYNHPNNLAVKFKHQVRALTRSYIKMGILVKGACEVCLTKENVEAHHDDYTKPMEIRWLCRRHHREHHRNQLKGV